MHWDERKKRGLKKAKKVVKFSFEKFKRNREFPADLKTKAEKMSFVQDFLKSDVWHDKHARKSSRKTPQSRFLMWTQFEDTGSFASVLGSVSGLVLRSVGIDDSARLHFVFEASEADNTSEPVHIEVNWDGSSPETKKERGVSSDLEEVMEGDEDLRDVLDILEVLEGQKVVAAWANKDPVTMYILWSEGVLLRAAKTEDLLDLRLGKELKILPEILENVSALSVESN